VSRYHLNSFFTTKGKKNALCDWQTPVYALTGIPVTVYSTRVFLRQLFQATSALLPCGDFHHWVSVRPSAYSTTSLLLYQVTGLDTPFGLLDQHRLLLMDTGIIQREAGRVKNNEYYDLTNKQPQGQ